MKSGSEECPHSHQPASRATDEAAAPTVMGNDRPGSEKRLFPLCLALPPSHVTKSPSSYSGGNKAWLVSGTNPEHLSSPLAAISPTPGQPNTALYRQQPVKRLLFRRTLNLECSLWPVPLLPRPRHDNDLPACTDGASPSSPLGPGACNLRMFAPSQLHRANRMVGKRASLTRVALLAKACCFVTSALYQ